MGNDKLIVIELACCFDTNFVKSRKHKINRYENIKKDCKKSKWTVDKIFAEVSSLGFITKDLNRFKKLCKTINSVNIHRLVNKLSEVTITASYYLYTQRNSE